MKKRNSHITIIIKEKKKVLLLTQDYYELQLMNLDIVQECQRLFKKKEYFQKKENSSNIKKEKCYNYNIIKYYINKCRKSRKLQNFIRTRR